MLKYIYTLLLTSLLLLSCKKVENQQQVPMADPPVENVHDDQNDSEQSIEIEVPSFKYKEANQFALEYASFAHDYAVATSHHDKEALKELGDKLNEYQKRGVELTKRVPADEAVEFQDFLNRIEQSFK